MPLKQPGFYYSVNGTFTKNKERITKFKETGDTKHIYRTELDKVCSQHDVVHGDFKDLARGTVSDKVLRDEGFNIAKNPKYDSYERGLASMAKSSLVVVLILKPNQNQQLADELHKPIIKRFKKKKCSFIFWRQYLAC